jgi:16S rRNA (uracil1498-N3)-methyltransferase
VPLSFYAPRETMLRGRVRLEGAEVRHAFRVMRKKPGDTVRLVDGLGTEYLARIRTIQDDRLVGEVIEETPSDTEPGTLVTLAPGLVKGARMDLLVEKATEIGAHEFWPVLCERSVRRVNRAKDRWQKVALSAIKQSGRAYLPRVMDPMAFDEVLKRRPEFDGALLADPESNRTLDGIALGDSVLVLLGPEGGFSEEELAAAGRAGFEPFSMGRRTLRAETASLVALALILRQRGEI